MQRQLQHYSSYLEKLLAWIIIILPPLLLIFWPLGINTKDTARGALITALVLWLLSKNKNLPRPTPELTYSLFLIFPYTFIAFMYFYQIARVYIGDQGLDFAIFTQAILSVRDVGQPLTTLVAPHEVNFLSHHLAIFLYPLGWLSRVTLPPNLIGITAQFISIGTGILFFFLFCRTLAFTRSTAAVFTTLLCLHPSFRSGISWGVHDEIFALGLIGVAIYSWSTNRHLIVACCLTLAPLFKETFLIASAIASSLAAITIYVSSHKKKREGILYGTLAALFLCLSILYFLVIPLLPQYFQLSFNASSRIAPMSLWLSTSFLAAKLSYLAHILIPLALLPLLSKRACALWLCASPFWGASLISGFADMHDPHNYYAVVPTFIAFFGAALTLSERRSSQQKLPAPAIFLATCLMCSFGYGIRPLKHLNALMSGDTILTRSLTQIPYDTAVVASDFDLAFILDKKTPLRQWMVERNKMKWDILLARKPPKQPVSQKLRSQTSLCYEDSQWQIFCRHGVTLPLQDMRP